MNPKKCAPGLQIRCLRCDFAEPWDQAGVRLKASGRKFVFGRCPHCKRIRFRVIEEVPDPKARGF